MTSLKIGWFQPLEVEVEESDYAENFMEIWEQMEYEYDCRLTACTKVKRFVWRVGNGWIDFQKKVLLWIEPEKQ